MKAILYLMFATVLLLLPALACSNGNGGNTPEPPTPRQEQPPEPAPQANNQNNQDTQTGGGEAAPPGQPSGAGSSSSNEAVVVFAWINAPIPTAAGGIMTWVVIPLAAQMGDPRVATAIAQAIEWPAVSEAIYQGEGEIAPTRWEPEGVRIPMNDLPYDPQRARMLLAEAGYEPGSIEVALLFPANVATAERIVGQIAPALEEIGIIPLLYGVPYGDMIEAGRTKLAAGENVLFIAPAE